MQGGVELREKCKGWRGVLQRVGSARGSKGLTPVLMCTVLPCTHCQPDCMGRMVLPTVSCPRRGCPPTPLRALLPCCPISMHARTNTQSHTRTRAHVYTHTQMYTHRLVHTYTTHVHTCTHRHTRTHTHRTLRRPACTTPAPLPRPSLRCSPPAAPAVKRRGAAWRALRRGRCRRWGRTYRHRCARGCVAYYSL